MLVVEKCILIDGSGLIYRGFYAIPPFLKSPAGVQTNAVFGFTNILLSLITHQKPDYIAVAFDKKGPTFRHKEFKEYKATRVKAPQELYDQIPLVKDVVATFGIPAFETDGFEADDILATIVKRMPHDKVETYIATGDFDMFQVIGPNVFILYPARGFKEADVFGRTDMEKKYGLSPQQIADFKGLAGDSSDNIPGVFGIGEKGAKDLLYKYKNLENIYKHLDELPAGTRKKLEAGRESALQSKNLATLRSDVPLNFVLSDCRVKRFDVDALHRAFGKFGFKSLQKRLDELYGTANTQGSLFG